MARLHNLTLMLRKQKKRRVAVTKIKKKKKSNKLTKTLKRRGRRRPTPRSRKKLWMAISMAYSNSQKKLTRLGTKTFQKHTKNWLCGITRINWEMELQKMTKLFGLRSRKPTRH